MAQFNIPLKKLHSLPAEIWKPERAERVRQASSWQELPPITIGILAGQLTLADGNHRLCVARERGWSHIRANFPGHGRASLRVLGLL